MSWNLLTKRWLSSIIILALAAISTAAETSSLCVAPVPVENDGRSAPGLQCNFEDFSLKIDGGNALQWPVKESIRIDGLDATARHRVVIFCRGKPHQSFSFRFSEFNGAELCLFLNDLYKTAQLWEKKDCPWCKCK